MEGKDQGTTVASKSGRLDANLQKLTPLIIPKSFRTAPQLIARVDETGRRIEVNAASGLSVAFWEKWDDDTPHVDEAMPQNRNSENVEGNVK